MTRLRRSGGQSAPARLPPVVDEAPPLRRCPKCGRRQPWQAGVWCRACHVVRTVAEIFLGEDDVAAT